MTTVTIRLRKLVEQSRHEKSAVSWPALTALGALAEHHFLSAAEALEADGHGSRVHSGCPGCEVLAGLESELDERGQKPYLG